MTEEVEESTPSAAIVESTPKATEPTISNQKVSNLQCHFLFGHLR